LSDSGPRIDTPPQGQLARRDAGLIGRVIGNYEIIRELGRGGMGAVYEARHLHMDRTVAIKSLLPAIAGDEGTLQRLFREQQILDGLRHANIVALHDVHVQDDGVFLVMEYIEGVTLEQRLRKAGPLEPPIVAAIGQQLLAALAHTHARGVVHRDIKPGNIMLARSDAKLLDFGIAKAADSSRLTAPDMVFGSPAYMPPELWAGKPATPASDLYALALCLYEALVGEPALKSESGWQAYYALHTTTSITHLGSRLPKRHGWLAEAIYKATRGDPADRFVDAKAMLAVFREHQGMSGEISLAALEVDLAMSGPQDATPGPGPTAELPRTQDSGPTLVRPLETTARPRWPRLVIAAALSAGVTAAALQMLQPSPPEPAILQAAPSSPVPTAPAQSQEPPAAATPVETRPSPSEPTPAHSSTKPGAVAPAPAPEPEPESPTPEPAVAAPPSLRHPCGAAAGLESRATAGALTPADHSCLADALAASERQTEQDRLSRYLLADARARGDMTSWAKLAARHLADITQSDPVLCYQYAAWMRQNKRHSETIRWADRALENKQDFPETQHAGWVTALLKFRAMAAHDSWAAAEGRYTQDRLSKDRNAADRARADARTFAKEWYDFAKEAGTGADQARRVCHTVAGTTSLCP